MMKSIILFTALFTLITSCSSYIPDDSLTGAIKPWKEGEDNSEARTKLRNSTHKASLNKELSEAQEANLLYSLNKSTNSEVKEFLIHELQLVGGTASIKPLAKYLMDPQLCSHATMALLAINNHLNGRGVSDGYFSSFTVADALAEVLPKAKGKNLILILKTIGSVKKAKNTTLLEINKLCNAEDQVLKQAAFRALANIASPASAKVLLNSLAGETLYNRSKMISYNLLYARNLADNKAATSHTLQIMSKIDREKEDHSFIKSLATLQSINGTSDDLINYLSDENLRIRAAVSEMLIKNDDQSINQKLVSKFPTSAPPFQIEAVKIFVKRKFPEAGDLVSQGLNSKNQHLRSVSAEYSAYVPPSTVIEPLIKLALNGTTEDQTNALAALKRIPGKHTKAALVKAYHNTKGQTKASVIDVLSYQQDSEVSEVILTATVSIDKTIRKAAFNALKKNASFSQVPKFISMLQSSKSSSDMRGYQSAIITAAFKKEDETVALILKSIQSNSSSKTNLTLIQLLSRLGGKKAFRGLLALYGNGAEEVQKEAARTLSKWTSMDQRHDLMTFCKNLEGKNRTLVIRGISSLIVNSTSLKIDKEKYLTQLAALVAEPTEKAKILNAIKALK